MPTATRSSSAIDIARTHAPTASPHLPYIARITKRFANKADRDAFIAMIESALEDGAERVAQ